MSQRTKKGSKEPTNREILGKVGKLGDRVGKLEVRVGRLEGKVDKLGDRVGRLEGRVTNLERAVINLESKMEEKFDAVLGMLDGLGKKMDDKRDEQKAGFANYQTLDQKVEAHDKDIRLIKGHLNLAGAA